jgi:ribonuclease-3
MEDFKKLEKRLGYSFTNRDLLKQALVHRSFLNENPDFELGHNERLEFLGDAVLEIVVTERLYHDYPDKTEGEMTDWRASLVNATMLSEVANELGIEDYLYLSRGEAKDKNTKARQIILANAIEAVIGALYLDGGLKAAKRFIIANILSQLERVLKLGLYHDPKSKFQEKAQELYNITPRYEVLKEYGPDHDKMFEVGLYLDDDLVASGSGSSKHEAQVDAATKGLAKKKWQGEKSKKT